MKPFAKLLFSLLMLIAFSVCAVEKNKAYYLLHPDAIALELQRCVSLTPKPTSCEASRLAQIQLSQWYLLYRSNPQGFGKKILANQTQLANALAKLKNLPVQSTEKQALLQKIQAHRERQKHYYVVIQMTQTLH